MSMETILVWSCLLLAGLGVALSVVLFLHRQGNVAANRLVGVLVLLLSLRLAELAGYWTAFFADVPHLLFTTSAIPFLFGPLLYLYGRTILRRGSRLKWYDPIHALPFVTHAAYLFPFYLMPGDTKREAFAQIALRLDTTVGTGFLVLEGGQTTQLAIYSLATFFLITRATIGRKPTAIARTAWLRKMLALFGIFILIDLVHFIDLAFLGHVYLVWVDVGVVFFQTVVLWSIGYSELTHPELHEKVSELSHDRKQSLLIGEQVRDYLYRLTRAMELDHWYRDASLGMTAVAERLNIPMSHLEELLEDHLQKTFEEFLNEYRVEEATRILSTDESSARDLSDIAQEVGFADLLAFETAFLHATGKTPEEYRS